MENSADSKVSKNVVLLIATMASFIAPFMGSSMNIALPSIGKEFAMDAIMLSWVATSYPLTAAVFLVPLGRIADIHGRKKVFAYGIVIYTVSSLLAAMSISAIMLISFRILQGIGVAMIFGTGIAILTSVFPAGERGKALGINTASVYSGLSLGPVVGGILTQQFGWRSIFFVPLLLGSIVIVLVLWKLKGEWAEAKGEKFDLAGSIIYGISIIAVIYGFSLIPAMRGVLVLAAGVLGITAFIRWEMRVKSPVLHMDLFKKNTVFVFSNLAAFINYSATFAVAFLLSLYLQYAKGFSPQNAGLILVAMPIVQAIFSPVAGRLSDRIEPRILASAGMALNTVGLVFFHFLTENTTIEYILVSLVVLGFGFALFSSPNTNAIMGSVEKRYYGVASATLATMRQVGMTVSLGIVMMIFTIFIGRVEITPEYYPAFLRSVSIAFVVFAVLCFVGVFASLARGKVR